MKTILFQGDSITDACRSRVDDYNRGHGYATLVSATLGYERPNDFYFMNRGVSGDRSIDILARIKPDIIHLKPDYISILVGVNDVGYHFSRENGIDADTYELYYSLIIEQIKAALPDTKIMILEPFALKGSNNEGYWEPYVIEIEKHAASAKKVAEKYGLVFVPLLQKFREACETAPANMWLEDGVHPTARGHELIKREWLNGFAKLEQEV